MKHRSSTSTTPADTGAALALFALVVAALMLVSPDSYLHDLYNRVDSAWFYMCGKAWMNGMRPYVDFSDSKGPLLWLIYGVGHLISARDYTGVLWLSVASYTITLWITYRSALMLLGDRRWALLCAMLMPLAYFYPYIHEETKTEDFAQPFVAWCLLGCITLVHHSRLQHTRVAGIMAGIGFCMGCVLMMKYSLTAMLGIFAVYGSLAARRHRVNIATSLGWTAAGAAVALLPWGIYFSLSGNFTAFVQEYFVNTLDTLKYLRQQNGNLIDLLNHLRQNKIVLLFPLLCTGGALLFSFKFHRMRWMAVVTTAWFFICTVPNAWWIYYYNSCTWTLLFGFTSLLSIAKDNSHRQPSRWTLAVAAAVVVMATGAWSVAIVPQNFFLVDHKARNTYYRYVYLMQQVEHPRVIYWDIYSTGFETAAMGLPACKYWAGQNGATPAMKAAQALEVSTGKPDFVFVADTVHDAMLQQWGYHKWDFSDRNDTDRCDDLLFTLYTRHRLKAPPPHFAPPSPREILTKRWHLH